MSRKLGVVRGTISLGGARLAVNLLNASGIVVLARILTPADFGIVAISTTALTVVASFTEVSLQPALIQCLDPTQEHIDTVWTLSALRALLILTAFTLAAWPLSVAYGDHRLLPVFLITGLTGAMLDFINPLVTLSMRYMRFGPLTIFQIGQKLSSLLLALGLALYLRSFWAIIIGNALGAILASLLSYQIVAYRPRFTLSKFSEIWGFSGWIFANQLCQTLNWRFDQLLIGLWAPRASLGQYSVADNLAVIPSRELTNPMSSALFAGMVAAKADPIGKSRSFIRAQSLMAMVTAPLVLGLCLVAAPAVQVILGAKWIDCVDYVRIFALTYLLGTFTSAVQPLLMSSGKTKTMFLQQFAILIVRIPLITFGLLAYGIVGAALGGLVSGLFQFVINTKIAAREVQRPFTEIVQIHAATIFGLVMMSSVLLLLDMVSSQFLTGQPLVRIAVMALFGGFVYGVSILLLWQVRGRPDGPVLELLTILQGLWSTLSVGKKMQ